MKTWILLAALLVPSCSTVKVHDPFRNPDGTLNVVKILQYVQYGIEADCQLGTTPTTEAICTFGRSGITAAIAIANQNPSGAIPAVHQALLDLEAQVPTVKPYVDWALLLLN